MRRISTWVLAAATVALAALPTAVEAQDAPPLPEGVTQAMVEQGSEIFAGAGNCVACHGEEGAGSDFAPPLNDEEWLNIDGMYPAIVELINTGVPEPKQSMLPMAARGGAQIDDEQVRAVAAYVWRLSNGG